MTKIIIKKENGFTLIETIVVVASMALIVTAISGITLAIFKSQNRNSATQKVVSEGNFILDELKNNVLNSGGQINCDLNNTSVGVTNMNDGGSSVISCGSGNIASNSANLNDSDVSIICGNFVTCSTLPSTEVTGVHFNFGVGATVAGVGVSQNFSIDVAVRN